MLTSKNFSDIVAFTRSTATWRYSSGGILVQDSANVPRLDYDPIALAARGLLVEEQRTNLIRNNSMVGAAAGSPGTLPTNWAVGGALSSSIDSSGTEDGIPYIDLRLFGTSSNTFLNIQPESTAVIPAASGQTWTAAAFVRLIAGDLTNVSDIRMQVNEYTSGGAFVKNTVTTSFKAQLSGAPLRSQRYSAVGAMTDATTGRGLGLIGLSFSNGVVIDCTLRIGLPTFEQGTFASSPIPTTTAQVTRAADNAIITDLSRIGFNPREGTIFFGAECYNANATQNGGNSPRLAVLYSSSNGGENIALYRGSGTNQASAQVSTGGQGFPVTGPVIANGSTFKLAFAYKAGDSALCLNGAAVNTLAQATLPSGLDRMVIGSTGGAGYWGGWIRQVRYFPRRMTNAELQALTT